MGRRGRCRASLGVHTHPSPRVLSLGNNIGLEHPRSRRRNKPRDHCRAVRFHGTRAPWLSHPAVLRQQPPDRCRAVTPGGAGAAAAAAASPCHLQHFHAAQGHIRGVIAAEDVDLCEGSLGSLEAHAAQKWEAATERASTGAGGTSRRYMPYTGMRLYCPTTAGM